MAVKTQIIENDYAIYHGDSCEVLPTIPSNSIGLTVYSPPFAELYNYSSDERDLSNCKSRDEFLEHYSFIVKEISRITIGGRNSCVHCMDMLDGTDGRNYDLPGHIIKVHEENGMYYMGRVLVWKEPYAVRMRTMVKSLAHCQIVEDASLCSPANPDYVLIFRKGGQSQQPVTHEDGLTEYAGLMSDSERNAMGFAPIPAKYLAYKGRTDVSARENKWSHWVWRQYASSVWMDVRAGRLLPYRQARETETEKHICPLQLDVIERCVHLYSNRGDTVLTPFMGIGSEVYTARRLGRKAIGVELKEAYFNQAALNVADATKELNDMEIFSDEDFAE